MTSQANSRKISWHLPLIFCCLSLGILLIGYIYYQHQVAHIKQAKQNDLVAIMDLKIQQIANWRQERLGDAKVIFQDRFLALRIKDYLEGRGAPELKEEILERLAALMIYQYQKAILIGGHGEVELSYPQERRACDSYTKKLVAEVRQRKEIIFSDLYLDEVAKKIRLSLLVPILSPKDQTLVGVILLIIDPQQFLYPLLQTWPTPSRTAETELFRKEGNEVVFLNELRHRQGSALTIRLPIDSPNLCAAMVARGGKGVFEGKDYRGISVLAAGDKIPDSPWSLIAEVDAEEIFAPLAPYVRMTGLLLLTLVTGSGLGLAYVWRKQQAVFYRRQFEAEHEKLYLAQRYEYLTQYANDIILLADQDLRIVEANDRAVKSYGFSREELLSLKLLDLCPPEIRQLLAENLRQAEEQAGLIFEVSQQRKDGSTFPGEISLRLMEVDDQKLYQEIIRDVTKRKLAEDALRRSEGHLAEAQRIAHLGSWEWDILTDMIIWSDEVCHIHGLPLNSSPPSFQDFLRCVHTDDRQIVMEKVGAALKGEESYRLDFRIVRPDGAVRFLHNEGEVDFDPSGQPVSLLGVVQDITELKRTEEALRESEKGLRQLTEQLLTAQESERQRISLLLHDELGQGLILFKFQVNALRDNLRKENCVAADDCLDILQYLDGLINKVRQISQDLNPPSILGEQGFQAALMYLIEEFSKFYHIHPDKLTIDEIKPLFSREALISIYRIFQECLLNIGRHAHASQISIEVKKQENQVSFMIQDNGRGFDMAQVMVQNALKSGLGIISIQERVRILGGTINIWSEPGRGTRISFIIPINELKVL